MKIAYCNSERTKFFFLPDSLFDMVVTATSFIKCEQHVVVTIKMSDRKKAGKLFSNWN